MPSQSDERSCGRETDHNGSRWWRVGGVEGQVERWESERGEVYSRVTGVEENIIETDESETYIQKNTKLKCTVKDKRPPGNYNGLTGILDNDAVGC